MTQPVGSYRNDPLSGHDASPPPPSQVPPSRPSSDEPPPDHLMLADVGSRFSGPFMSAIASSISRSQQRDIAVQRGLDAFRAAMTPEYSTPEGPVRVPTPFGMSSGYKNQGTEGPYVPGFTPPGVQCGLVRAGRGSPDDVRRATQALIDAGKLSRDASVPLDQRVRRLMFDHHIGVDCAGYTQGAYAQATGRSVAPPGRGKPAVDEDLSTLGHYGFSRVGRIGDVRAGDIVALQPPAPGLVGHCAIVYSQRVATTVADLSQLLEHGSAGNEFATGGPVRELQVDSSWGCGDAHQNGNPAAGGVLRQTWWYNESTKQWAWLQGENLCTGSQPYGHPVDGIYHRPSDAEPHVRERAPR